jgi:hypothetical protein
MIDKVAIPEASKGEWRVERFKVDREDWSSLLKGRGVPVGEEFTRLMRDHTLVMSDTPAEMRDHYTAVRQAKGDCLINGLGLGMVLKAILKKPEVTSVTVVEVAQEVLDLVAPYYDDARVTFVCASAFDYQPPKDSYFQMVWHDIWDTICVDNLPEMHVLHRKYGRRAHWQGAWCRASCERGR